MRTCVRHLYGVHRQQTACLRPCAGLVVLHGHNSACMAVCLSVCARHLEVAKGPPHLPPCLLSSGQCGSPPPQGPHEPLLPTHMSLPSASSAYPHVPASPPSSHLEGSSPHGPYSPTHTCIHRRLRAVLCSQLTHSALPRRAGRCGSGSGGSAGHAAAGAVTPAAAGATAADKGQGKVCSALHPMSSTA